MKNIKKFFALGLSIVLVISTLGGCSSTDTISDDDQEEVAVIQDALDELEGVSDLISHSDTAGKNETVYAILDGDGQVEQTIVSEWLKNPEGSTSVSDITELSDITVVKGNAEYTKEGSGNQVIWSTDGGDVYYQGYSEKELPVDVHVTYELDGKEVKASEVAGASGHLKITFTYENHLSKNVKINGKNCKIYQPFVMISGMMLDNTKAKNVTVENGSAVNSGDNTIVFGLAMPGLKESMGLDNAKDGEGQLMDLDIPESVTVEADVTDFSLMMTLTLASNNALSQMGLDDIDSVDDLKADIDQLTNGMSDIVDGASQLDDGTNELKDGIDTINGKTPQLSSGVSAMTSGANKLLAGVDKLTDKNEKLQNGAAQLAGGLAELEGSLTAADSKQKLTTLISGSADFANGINNVSDSLTKMAAGYNYSSGDLASLISGLEQYAQGLEATQDQTNMAYAGYIRSMIGTYKELYNDVTAVQNGVSVLSDSYKKINDGIGTVAGNINQISSAVTELSDGADNLKSGIDEYTAGVSQVSEGMQELDDGLNSLNGQVPALVKGIGQLADGVVSLTAGTLELKDGVIKFDEEGIQKLSDLIENDLEGYFDRIKAVQEYADEYTSFAGCEEGTECSVKFIYKTAGITLE